MPIGIAAHPAGQRALTTNHVSPGAIETLASCQIPTAQNWGELTRLLVGPKPPRTTCTVLSPDGSFFAVNPRIMKELLSTAQNTIAMGLNSHTAYFTLNLSDIPTVRDQADWYGFLPSH